MKTQFLFLTVLAVVMVSGDDSPHVYCGRRLAVALSYMCDNEYLMKRAPYNSLESEGSGWRWLQPQRARHLAGARGKRGGIVEECCEKPCAINELLSYC